MSICLKKVQSSILSTIYCLKVVYMFCLYACLSHHGAAQRGGSVAQWTERCPSVNGTQLMDGGTCETSVNGICRINQLDS